MEKEIKAGMLLWLKAGKSYPSLVKIKDKHGNILRTYNAQVRDAKKEVRIMDIEYYPTGEEPTIIYYEVGVLGKPVNSAPLSRFDWHPNNRTCWSCKKTLSQTSENICKQCGGVCCDIDGYCLCDHPKWGQHYQKRV